MKTFEGLNDDNRKMIGKAIKYIKDYFIKYDMWFLLLSIEHKDEDGNMIYYVETLQDKDIGDGKIKVEYIDYSTPNNKNRDGGQGYYALLENIPMVLLFAIYDQLNKMNETDLLELSVIGGNITTIMSILSHHPKLELQQGHLDQITEIEDYSPKTDSDNYGHSSDYDFQKILIEKDEKYIKMLINAKVIIDDKIKEEYSDLFDSEELGLL